jgi:hypothetical protein
MRPEAASTARWAARLAGVVILGVGLVRVWTSDVRRLASGLQDDSFYYLLPAWRAWDAGYLTFDGEHPTFSLQPGYAAFLVLLAGFAASREVFFRLALSASFILYVGVGLLLARWFGRSQAPDADPAARGDAGSLAACAWYANTTALLGFTTLKENALYALVLACAALLALPRARCWRLDLLLGLLLGVGVATRLTGSTLLVSVVLAVGALGATGRFVSLARIAVGAVLGYLPFAVYGLATVGRVTTSAGAIKTAGLARELATGEYWLRLPTYIARIPEYLLGCFRYSLGFRDDYFHQVHAVVAPGFAGFVVGPLVVMGFVVAAIGGARLRRDGVPRHRLGLLLALFAVACLGLASNPLLLGPAGELGSLRYPQWYVVVLPVACALLAGVSGLVLSARLRAAACVVLAGIAAVQAVLVVRAEPSFEPSRDSWSDRMVVAAEELGRTLPRGERIGAGNAGALGWFLRVDAAVVNLDGLANEDVFAWRRASGAPVGEYLIGKGIRYVCDVLVEDGWFGNPFDRVGLVRAWPFDASPEYDGFFLLEVAPDRRFPDFWPVDGGRGGSVSRPHVVCVPWIERDPLDAGRGGAWANFRVRATEQVVDGPAFWPGGRFERLRFGVGSGVGGTRLVVLGDGRPLRVASDVEGVGDLERVELPAGRWVDLGYDVRGVGRIELSLRVESTVAARDVWFSGLRWDGYAERPAPVGDRTAVVAFGSGGSDIPTAPVPSLELVRVPGEEGRFRAAISWLPGEVCRLSAGAPDAKRLGRVDRRDPCVLWVDPGLTIWSSTATTDEAGRASLDLPPLTGMPNADIVLQVVFERRGFVAVSPGVVIHWRG